MYRSGLFAALMFLIGTEGAVAESVSFTFGGFIQTVEDTHGVLDGSIVPEGRIYGQVRYDTDATDVFSDDPTLGGYWQNPPVSQLRVELGSYVLEVPESIAVSFVVDDNWRFAPENPPSDGLGWRMEGNTFPFPGTASSVVQAMIFSIGTEDDSVLSSDELPLHILDIADFPDSSKRRFSITGCLPSEIETYCSYPESIAIFGIIDTVPEPGTAASSAAALGALGVLHTLTRRRRARR